MAPSTIRNRRPMRRRARASRCARWCSSPRFSLPGAASSGWRRSMKNGFRVFDSDTHVLPCAEVLERYVDPEFRPRLAELAEYRAPIRASAEHSGDGKHGYRIAPRQYRRVLGEPAPRKDHTGRDTHWMGSKLPRPGVQDDDAANRILDMDDEGTDRHFLVPGGWSSAVGLDDPS